MAVRHAMFFSLFVNGVKDELSKCDGTICLDCCLDKRFIDTMLLSHWLTFVFCV